MLVGAFGASAFGIRGGIPMYMEAAQTSLYCAPAYEPPMIIVLMAYRNSGHAQW